MCVPRRYATILKPLVKKVARGQTATVVAFGQTGSGKTHTVRSLCVRFPDDLFRDVALKRAAGTATLRVELSAVELLGKDCRDLLSAAPAAAATSTGGGGGSGRAVAILEGPGGDVVLTGATVAEAPDAEALVELLAKAGAARATAATAKHDASSRSHAVYTITLVDASGASAFGRLTLADLAGSERGTDRTRSSSGVGGGAVSKERMAESVAINASLSALRECMRASDAYHFGGGTSSGNGSGCRGGAAQVSVARYRQNALTLLLRDAFAFGDSATVFVCCLSPLASDAAHSKSSLLYTKGILDRQRERAQSATASGSGGEVGGSGGGAGGAEAAGCALFKGGGDPATWDKRAVAEFVELLAVAFVVNGAPATKAGATEAGATEASAAEKAEVAEWVAAFRLAGPQLLKLSRADAVARAGGLPAEAPSAVPVPPLSSSQRATQRSRGAVVRSPPSPPPPPSRLPPAPLLSGPASYSSDCCARRERFGVLLFEAVAALAARAACSGLRANALPVDVAALAAEATEAAATGAAAAAADDAGGARARASEVDSTASSTRPSPPSLRSSKASAAAGKASASSRLRAGRGGANVAGAKTSDFTYKGGGGSGVFGGGSTGALDRLAELLRDNDNAEEAGGANGGAAKETGASGEADAGAVRAAVALARAELAGLADLETAARKALAQQAKRKVSAEERRAASLNAALAEGRASLAAEHTKLRLLVPALAAVVGLTPVDAEAIAAARAETARAETAPKATPPPPVASLEFASAATPTSSSSWLCRCGSDSVLVGTAPLTGASEAASHRVATAAEAAEAAVAARELSALDGWAASNAQRLGGPNAPATAAAGAKEPAFDVKGALAAAEADLDAVEAMLPLAGAGTVKMAGARAALASASAAASAAAAASAVGGRQRSFKALEGAAKEEERAFSEARAALEAVCSEGVGAAKRRRDDACEALLCAGLIVADGGVGGGVVGGVDDSGTSGDGAGPVAARRIVVSSEVAELVGQYEATKQSWADFWASK